jgi:hypothetical protein
MRLERSSLSTPALFAAILITVGSEGQLSQVSSSCNDLHEDIEGCLDSLECTYHLSGGCAIDYPPVPPGCYPYVPSGCVDDSDCPENHTCQPWNYYPCEFSECQGCPSDLEPICTPNCLTTCTSDLNCNGSVDIGDLLQMLARWGPCAVAPPVPCRADLDDDGVIDVPDVMTLLKDWGPCG